MVGRKALPTLSQLCRVRIAYPIYVNKKEQTLERNDLNKIICLAEEKAIVKADTAYKNYLDGNEPVHDFKDVMKELGLED